MVLAKLEELSEGPIRSVDCFEKLDLIGVGTYGQVFKAREKATGEIVALKKLLLKDNMRLLPVPIVREITILKKLDHQNVIKLREIVTSVVGQEGQKNNDREGDKFNGDIYMVFEYMDNDLGDILVYHGQRLTVPQIKCYMKQILDGLHHCHTHNVLHRDIKGSNILVDDKGTLKIADFGLARSFSPDRNEILTNKVMTLWFKPPELLLGSIRYGPEVDMWSVGCVFGGLLKGQAIMTGKTESDQLKRIFDLCGSPNEVNWRDAFKLPGYYSLELSTPVQRRVREMFINVASDAVDLLDNLLTLDPSKRWTTTQALEAGYFSNDPPPSDPESLPKYESLQLDPVKKEKLKQQVELIAKKRQENLQMQQQQQQQQQLMLGGLPNHLMINPLPTVLVAPPYHYHQGPPLASYWYPSGVIGSYNSNLGLHVGYHSNVPCPPQMHWLAHYSRIPVPVSLPREGATGHGVGWNTWHRGSASGDSGAGRRNTWHRGSTSGGRGGDRGLGPHRGSPDGGGRG